MLTLASLKTPSRNARGLEARSFCGDSRIPRHSPPSFCGQPFRQHWEPSETMGDGAPRTKQPMPIASRFSLPPRPQKPFQFISLRTPISCPYTPAGSLSSRRTCSWPEGSEAFRKGLAEPLPHLCKPCLPTAERAASGEGGPPPNPASHHRDGNFSEGIAIRGPLLFHLPFVLQERFDSVLA